MHPLDPDAIRRLTEQRESLESDWYAQLAGTRGGSDHRVTAETLRSQTREFVDLLLQSLATGNGKELRHESWAPSREYLERLSASRARAGASTEETAAFIFSLKKPMFALIQQAYADQGSKLATQTWAVSELIDELAMHTFSTFQRSREDVIARQRDELLELSTPVVKLWDGVLALPLIGTLDSVRSQAAMESLLTRIVEVGAEIAIIDITGVPTVDTLVAQHLLKTVTAIRLMGADCIISGIRPQIAQTIVHLGVDLQGVTTKSSLADALALAFKRTGVVVARPKSA